MSSAPHAVEWAAPANPPGPGPAGSVARPARAIAPRTGVVLAGIALVFSVLCLRYLPESVDDAYISLRYARHLVDGQGLSFNTSGERVEGFSNFAWVALMAGMQELGAVPILAAKATSFAAGLLTLLLIFVTGRRVFGSDPPALWAAALFGVSSFHAVWAVDGMETMAFACLLAAALALVVGMLREDPARRHRGIDGLGLGVVLSLLCLMRPEGVLYAALITLPVLVSGTSGRKPALVALGLAGCTVLAYAVFRLDYYGHLIPNTGANKLHPGIPVARRGLKYLITYAMSSGLPVATLVVLGIGTARARRGLAPVIAATAAGAFFILLAGGDFMWAYRFVVHFAPALALLAVQGLLVVHARLGARAWATAVAGLTCLASAGIGTYVSLPTRAPLARVELQGRSVHFQIGGYLRELRPRPSDRLLLSEAGIIPYEADLQVDDYLGLVSPYAWAYRDGAPDPDRMLGQSPRFVLLTTITDASGRRNGRLREDRAILADPAFRAHYRERQVFVIPRDGDLLERLYYERAPDAREIRFELYERGA